jgi:DNA-binding transcriptional MerR regulator
MRKVTIGHLAKLVGIPAKTIRFYEEAGLLRPPERTESGYRLYGPDDVRRVQLIKQAKLLGLTLGEIKDLLDQTFDQSCQDLQSKLLQLIPMQLAEMERRIAELEASRGQLEALQEHLRHAGASWRLRKQDRVATCEFCSTLMDDPAWERRPQETRSL